MDTVAAFASRRQDALSSVGVAPLPDGGKALAVIATYLLSEEGRKASLLAGGDGRAKQQLTIEVPVNRLHLVSVDLEGVAQLKLRPRYELDGEQRVVRIDEVPTYDVPPTMDDLFKEAARNHQLQRSYDAERRAAKERRRESDRERRTRVAQTFLADQTQRALVHPAPTAKRCYIATETGRIVFDGTTDVGTAREVPAEAHHRFRADLRARRDRNLQDRAAHLALHEEKKRIIAEWMAAHGTAEQRARQDAGVLPMDEAIEAMTDEAFAAVCDRPVYVHDGIAKMQACLHRCADYTDVSVTRGDLLVTNATVDRMSAAQFALVQDVRRLLPDATVALRSHKVSWKRNPQVALDPIFGLLVTQRVGPFTFRREYATTE